MMHMRLDKFLADAGLGTRSEVKKLLREGKITVDNVKVTAPETKVGEGSLVAYNGTPVGAAPKHLDYLLNKPTGYLSATEDREGPTVLDLLPPDKRRNLFPVGRLDKDTEGLLLITDDGAFAHELLSPHRHVDKTYYARVTPALTEKAIPLVEEGLDIGDEKKTLPGKLTILKGKEGEEEGEILLTIHEGRYHQVKRMAEALGSTVTYLKRLSMGEYSLPEDLKPGEYILLEK
ncbi:MAG: rRNA pseudouridine synthase [Blautia sp.]|nr:rRNA pseudouridine synthase [Blautia sp.]